MKNKIKQLKSEQADCLKRKTAILNEKDALNKSGQALPSKKNRELNESIVRIAEINAELQQIDY